MSNFLKLTGVEVIAAIVAVITVGAVAGWVLNLMHVIQQVSEPVTLLLVIETIGLFLFPLGAILGWIV